MPPPSRQLFEHFAGSALGTFTGDALGMPVEGMGPRDIQRKYGLLDDLVRGRFPAGHYTDDTEMMIALLEALVQRGDFDPETIAESFLKNYHPERGYGARIHILMKKLAAGVPWQEVGTDSFGNGSAMRTAPVGFFHYDDLPKLTQVAALQASITHRHPEALAGAVMQATAVALALKAGLEKQRPDPAGFIATVAGQGAKFDQNSADRLRKIEITPGPIERLIPQIRSQYKCSVKAIEAVGPAIIAYLYSPDFKQALTLAVNLGGDADTIAAMTGAIAGAECGLNKLPQHWLNRLENGPQGRDYVLNLCEEAVKLKSDATI